MIERRLVLLEPLGADQARDGWVVGEDAHDSLSPLDRGIEPFQRVGAADPVPVRPWEGHEGGHVAPGIVHAGGKHGQLPAGRVGQAAPMLPGGLGRVLHEHRPMAAEARRQCVLLANASALRMQFTRQRRQVALRTFDAPASTPSLLPMTSLTPRR